MASGHINYFVSSCLFLTSVLRRARSLRRLRMLIGFSNGEIACANSSFFKRTSSSLTRAVRSARFKSFRLLLNSICLAIVINLSIYQSENLKITLSCALSFHPTLSGSTPSNFQIIKLVSLSLQQILF